MARAAELRKRTAWPFFYTDEASVGIHLGVFFSFRSFNSPASVKKGLYFSDNPELVIVLLVIFDKAITVDNHNKLLYNHL